MMMYENDKTLCFVPFVFWFMCDDEACIYGLIFCMSFIYLIFLIYEKEQEGEREEVEEEEKEKGEREGEEENKCEEGEDEEREE